MIDRHGDGLIGEVLASKVREMKSLEGDYTSVGLVVQWGVIGVVCGLFCIAESV